MTKKSFVLLIGAVVFPWLFEKTYAGEVENTPDIPIVKVHIQGDLLTIKEGIACLPKKGKFNVELSGDDNEEQLIKMQGILDNTWREYKARAVLSLAFLPLACYLSKKHSTPLWVWAVVTTLAIGNNIWKFEKQNTKIRTHQKIMAALLNQAETLTAADNSQSANHFLKKFNSNNSNHKSSRTS